MSRRHHDAAALLRLQRLVADSGTQVPESGPKGNAARVDTTVARRLLLLRGASGLDRAEFACRVGPEDARSVEQRIWRYETERARAPLAWLATLAAMFDLPVEFFVSSDLRRVELHVLVHRLGPDGRQRLYATLRRRGHQ